MVILILAIIIFLFFCYAIYDAFIMPGRYGKTYLLVALKNEHRIDGIILVGLLGLVYYYALLHQSDTLTTSLLSILIVIVVYTYFIRQPKLILKQKGFIYANILIPYSRIDAINLSEDGALVIALSRKSLIIWVRNPADLKKIYQTMLAL